MKKFHICHNLKKEEENFVEWYREIFKKNLVHPKTLLISAAILESSITIAKICVKLKTFTSA